MAATKGPSKMEAVRMALKELGTDAMPVKIQDFVKSKFNLEMSTAHVSNYKTAILRAKKGRKPGAKADKAEAMPAPVASKATSSKASGLLSPHDVETVKELVGRVGEENLKSLIGILRG